MNTSLPNIAGFVSTGLFAVGTLPMLAKAFRTRDLASYRLGNILLGNVGNVIYSLYVFHLPLGPVWLLHSFNLLTTGEVVRGPATKKLETYRVEVQGASASVAKIA